MPIPTIFGDAEAFWPIMAILETGVALILWGEIIGE